MDWLCLFSGVVGGLAGYWFGLTVQPRRVIRRLGRETLQWQMRK
jgi:membrane protein YqaA with SNARE-associated domain